MKATAKPIPAETPTKLTITKPKIKWTDDEGIALRGFWLPRPMPSNGNQSIVVGGHFASGLRVSGIVKSITLLPTQIVRVLVEDPTSKLSGAIVFTVGGLYAEVDSDNFEVSL